MSNKPREKDLSQFTKLRTPIDHFREDQPFWKMQAIGLGVLMSVISILDTNKSITELPIKNDNLMTLDFTESESKKKKNENVISESKEVESEEDYHQAQLMKVQFESKFQELFAEEKKILLYQYKRYFKEPKISKAVFNRFLIEYSYQVERILGLTRQKLGLTSLDTLSIYNQTNEKIKLAKAFLVRGLKEVSEAEDKVQAISDFIKFNAIHKESQASFAGMFSEDNKPQGNCVTRALTALYLAFNADLPTPGIVLMPKHIAATSTNQSQVTMLDTVLSTKPIEEVGHVVVGGEILATFLAENEDSGGEELFSSDTSKPKVYEGLNPTGKFSNLKTPTPQDNSEQSLLERTLEEEYWSKTSKENLRAFNTNRFKKEITKFTSKILVPKLRAEALQMFESEIRRNPDEKYFFEIKDPVKTRLLKRLRSLLSDPSEVGLDEAEAKRRVIYSITSGCDGEINITTKDTNENMRFSQLSFRKSFNIILKPQTLKGLSGHYSKMDLTDLSDLSESNDTENAGIEFTLPFKKLTADEYYIDRSRLNDISKLAVSKSKLATLKLIIRGNLNEHDLKLLDGSNMTLRFQLEENVNMDVLKQIDLSKISFIWPGYYKAHPNLTSLKFKAIYIPWAFMVERLINHNVFKLIRSEQVFIKKSELDEALLSKIKQTGFDISKIETY